jgi:flagellar hook-associated protein 1 FlgK
VLVSGSKSFAVSTTQVGGTTNIVAGVDGQDVTSDLSGGDLGGVLQARDQQLPSYQNSLDSLAFAIGTKVNQQNELGVDGNGNPGVALFSLPATQSGAAAQIAIATTDPNAVAAAAIGEGSAGNTNASALADLSSATIVGGQTASGFLASFLGQIGSDTSAATTNNSAQQATLTQLTTQRDSLSGVSLDEEAAHLTEYQRAYQSAAQVFNIANTIMASALNLGVETSVA